MLKVNIDVPDFDKQDKVISEPGKCEVILFLYEIELEKLDNFIKFGFVGMNR